MSGGTLNRITGRSSATGTASQPRQALVAPNIPDLFPQFSQPMAAMPQASQVSFPVTPAFNPFQGGFNPMSAIAGMTRQPVEMPQNPFFGGQIPVDFSLPVASRMSPFQASRQPYQVGSANRAFEAEQAAAAQAAEAARQAELARVPMYDFGSGLEPARYMDMGGDSGMAWIPERTFDAVPY